MGDEKKIKSVKVVRTVKEPAQPTEEKPVQKDPIDLPTYDSRYTTILERSQESDPLSQWEMIRAWLKEEPESIKELRNAVRKHADIAERAKRIAQMAESEYAKFLLKCQDREQIWRVAALAFWEKEKEAGNVTKQITEKMVDDWVIEQHGDLHMELESRRIDLETVRDQLKSLVTQVNNKGHDLRKLLESETRRPAGTPNWMDDEKEKK